MGLTAILCKLPTQEITRRASFSISESTDLMTKTQRTSGLGEINIKRAENIGLFPRNIRLHSNFQGVATRDLGWKSALLLVICSMLLAGCRARLDTPEPYIEFASVPLADEGGPDKLDVIEGRIVGVHPELLVVLYARSGAWYVQPYADEPYTQIRDDSTWRSTTHLGTEYAALLVEPGYKPPTSVEVLPGRGDGVISVVVRKGEPVFWLRWWFLLLCVLACLSAILAVYSYRLHQTTRQLHLRFEERLADRTRVAQELHDTLLQGVVSASMQLHVAVDRLPEELPAKSSLTHVLQVIGLVVEEGRNALQRLRSSTGDGSLDVEEAFSRIQQEFVSHQQTGLQVMVKGHPRSVHPVIRDEVYRIGREALVNAFRHSKAKRIGAEVEYKARQLRVVVRDDGCGIDPQVLRSGGEEHRGIWRMRKGAERIGARLKIRSRTALGTEIVLSVPSHIAYPSRPPKNPLWWFVRWYLQTDKSGTVESEKGVT